MLNTRILIALLALAAGGNACADQLQLGSCKAPTMSPEAIRYQMEGKVQVELVRAGLGQAEQVKVASSSGWKLLDEMAMAAVRKCVFDRPRDAKGQRDTLDFSFTLPPVARPPVAPALAADSCAGGTLLRRVAPGTPGAVRVRTMVWTDGQSFEERVEDQLPERDLEGPLMKLVRSCRFTPASLDGSPVIGTALLAFKVDTRELSDAALRAHYQRMLPVLERLAGSRKQYKFAFVVLDKESTARAMHAEIAAGADYSAVAARHAADNAKRFVRDWSLPTKYSAQLAAALKATTAPGLHPAPVQTEAGWMILNVEGIRPDHPSFEGLQALLRRLVISGGIDEFVKAILQGEKQPDA